MSTEVEVVVPHLADAEDLASVHVQAWQEACHALLNMPVSAKLWS